MSYGYQRVAESLRREIESELASIGLLSRVFGRGKSPDSLSRKVSSNPGKYFPGGRLIQDAIGIRVVLYFHEDLAIVERILRSKYVCDDASCTIDAHNSNVFSVSRYNLVFELPGEYDADIPLPSESVPVDRTFEVQIRTILSEGWHEVEHDLRYKRKEDWQGFDDLSRGLNGVLATLETAEWSMRKIFDELAYKHYKDKRWDGLVHSVLRIRLSSGLGPELSCFFNGDPDSARKLVRMDRSLVIDSLSRLAPRIPLTSDNVIFVWNHVSLRNEYISGIAPRVIVDNMNLSGI